MRRPTVSLLMPVRDEERFIRDALASLSAQTLADFEAIVVDDRSADASMELARAHARDDARIRVVQGHAGGLVPALERARAEARAPYVGRMDISRRYERWINGLVTVEAAARDVFVECAIPNPTLLARREALAAAGGWRDRGWPEDYDLLLRLWARGARFRNLEQVVLRWRQHPARVTRTDPAYALEAFVRCKVHHLRATLLRGFDGVLVWGAGPVGKGFARELVGQGGRLRAFVDVDPRKLGQTVHGVPVVPVEDARRFADAFWVGAVAGEQGRERVRQLVAARGRRDGVDFVAVA